MVATAPSRELPARHRPGPATISREMHRNRNPRTGKYRPFQAQRRASVRRACSKEGKIRPSSAPRTSPSSPPNSTAAPAGPSAGRPPQTSSQHWNDHCVAMIAGIRPSPPCAPAHCSGTWPTSDSAPPTASTSSAAPPKSLTPQTDCPGERNSRHRSPWPWRLPNCIPAAAGSRLPVPCQGLRSPRHHRTGLGPRGAAHPGRQRPALSW